MSFRNTAQCCGALARRSGKRCLDLRPSARAGVFHVWRGQKKGTSNTGRAFQQKCLATALLAAHCSQKTLFENRGAGRFSHVARLQHVFYTQLINRFDGAFVEGLWMKKLGQKKTWESWAIGLENSNFLGRGLPGREPGRLERVFRCLNL
jgi:hypothetical protein